MNGLTQYYEGTRFCVYFIDSSNVSQFIAQMEIDDPGEATKVIALIHHCGDNGTPRNEQKCRMVRDNLYELKTKQTRVTFFYDGAGIMVCGYAFKKTGQKKVQDAHIDTAEKIRDQFIARRKNEKDARRKS